mgnify:FL=1
MEEVESKGNLASTAVAGGIILSRSEAKRLISQKAVKVNDRAVEDPDYELKKGDIVQIGPRRFFKVK